ncbi:hypothetical protein ODX89_004430 [Salmonella enterica]|nr:hypothetical protein [Salmonella enterica]EJF6030230.1 hypothetical protein [Salmonella enterica]EJW2002150.1 hypothetical protein [Salmonella enterica]EJW2035590.1 hypothetical protein [Salmonella enterica]EJW2080187.1 hypothetical protein [Salmonella enterica]
MPAVAALTHNSVFIAFKKRLQQNGKSGKSIVCAGMKKLLQIRSSIQRVDHVVESLFLSSVSDG